MQINEHIIKISGSANVPAGLDIGQDIALKVKGSVVKIEHLDNQDGTMNVRYVVKLSEVSPY